MRDAEKVIYDIGGNEGQNLVYYLAMAAKVVYIEANPALADRVRKNFSKFIEDGQLKVENVVANTDIEADGKQVDFYISNYETVWSQYTPPPNLLDFTKITVPTRNILSLFDEHGYPFYVKIDVEHYDHILLEHILISGVRPSYMSAEIHHIETLAHLISIGKYKAFKLVNGSTVAAKYNNSVVHTLLGPRLYSFQNGSAGPFANDIHGPWMTPAAVAKIVGVTGLGWKDVHVSAIDEPDLTYDPRLRVLLDIEH
jgi:FkbM family methyltransferase